MSTTSTTSLTDEQRIQFARDQHQVLRNAGLSRNLAHTVLGAAGPGQVPHLLRWYANESQYLAEGFRVDCDEAGIEPDDEEVKRAIADAIDVLATGLLAKGWGPERTKRVMRAIGLTVPKCHPARITNLLFGAYELARVGAKIEA